jgi:wobble nucleotide-excising tRNase
MKKKSTLLSYFLAFLFGAESDKVKIERMRLKSKKESDEQIMRLGLMKVGLLESYERDLKKRADMENNRIKMFACYALAIILAVGIFVIMKAMMEI